MTPQEYLNENNIKLEECVALKFVKTHPNAVLPVRKHDDLSTGDTGYDVTAVEDTVIPARSSALVPTGLTLADVPPGLWIRIESRSSLAFKHNVHAFNGIIDNCVPAGTMISTPVGDLFVEDLFNIHKHNSIISFNEETRDTEIDSITEMWVVPSLELTEICLEDGSVLRVPETKRVFTKTGWVMVKDLTETDEILSLN